MNQQTGHQISNLLEELVEQQKRTATALEQIARSMKTISTDISAIKTDIHLVRQNFVVDVRPTQRIDASLYADLD